MARRSRGSGSTWKRDDGRWVAQVTYRGADGRRKYLTRVKPNERMAKLALQGLQGRIGRDGELSETARILDSFLAEWLERVEYSVRPTTFRSYSGHVRMHISPLLGGIPVDDLRVQDIDRLIRDRQKAGLSAASVQRIITTLSMALEQSVREGVLARNVARLARRPRVQREPIEALTPERATDILEAVAGDRDEALYVLLLGSGMRVGEALGLDWRDIDFDRGTVFIRRGKTDRAVRTIPVAPFARDALRVHRARMGTIDPTAPVFTGERKGQRQRVDVITHRFPTLLQAKGLPRMRVHDLRHGHATLLLAAGVTMQAIADQLGHSNPNITAAVYVHVQPGALEKAVNALDEAVRRHR